jgi:hypothetical protein
MSKINSQHSFSNGKGFFVTTALKHNLKKEWEALLKLWRLKENHRSSCTIWKKLPSVEKTN